MIEPGKLNGYLVAIKEQLRKAEKKHPKFCDEIKNENCELTENINKLKYFLENNPEEKATQKQIEFMKKQLNAMECYKFYLCCRIADLVISDIEPKKKEESK